MKQIVTCIKTVEESAFRGRRAYAMADPTLRRYLFVCSLRIALCDYSLRKLI